MVEPRPTSVAHAGNEKIIEKATAWLVRYRLEGEPACDKWHAENKKAVLEAALRVRERRIERQTAIRASSPVDPASEGSAESDGYLGPGDGEDEGPD